MHEEHEPIEGAGPVSASESDQHAPRAGRRRRCGAVVVALSLASALTSCGSVEERSLCEAYEDMRASGVEIAEVDPTTASAVDAAAAVEGHLNRVRHVQELADGRYGFPLGALETAVNDVLITLESVPDDADYATWAPLVEDSLQDAVDAGAWVEQEIEPTCPSGR